MKWNMSLALYIVALIAVVVSVDLLFFRNRFWERLIANSALSRCLQPFLFEIPKEHLNFVLRHQLAA